MFINITNYLKKKTILKFENFISTLKKLKIYKITYFKSIQLVDIMKEFSRIFNIFFIIILYHRKAVTLLNILINIFITY